MIYKVRVSVPLCIIALARMFILNISDHASNYLLLIANVQEVSLKNFELCYKTI